MTRTGLSELIVDHYNPRGRPSHGPDPARSPVRLCFHTPSQSIHGCKERVWWAHCAKRVRHSKSAQRYRGQSCVEPVPPLGRSSPCSSGCCSWAAKSRRRRAPHTPRRPPQRRPIRPTSSSSSTSRPRSSATRPTATASPPPSRDGRPRRRDLGRPRRRRRDRVAGPVRDERAPTHRLRRTQAAQQPRDRRHVRRLPPAPRDRLPRGPQAPP